jgi:hypothetical protein
MLVTWARQDFLISRWFPQFLGLLVAAIDDPIARHPMVVNMWEEHGDGDPKRSHFALFQDLLGSIGQPTEYPPDTFGCSTLRFIEIQEQLAHESVLCGLGAFCYANEYITVGEFRPLWRAFEETYPAADVEFFAVNSEVDVVHAEQTEDVIEALVCRQSDLDAVEKGARLALNSRVQFYDDLMEPFSTST